METCEDSPSKTGRLEELHSEASDSRRKSSSNGNNNIVVDFNSYLLIQATMTTSTVIHPPASRGCTPSSAWNWEGDILF